MHCGTRRARPVPSLDKPRESVTVGGLVFTQCSRYEPQLAPSGRNTHPSGPSQTEDSGRIISIWRSSAEILDPDIQLRNHFQDQTTYPRACGCSNPSLRPDRDLPGTPSAWAAIGPWFSRSHLVRINAPWQCSVSFDESGLRLDEMRLTNDRSGLVIVRLITSRRSDRTCGRNEIGLPARLCPAIEMTRPHR